MTDKSTKCPHGKIKYICKECGGSRICQHGKQKHMCRECKGSGICEHNKFKHVCKICKGSAVCKHSKIKKYCRECDGSALCKSVWCETAGNKKYEGYCLRCCIYIRPDIKVSRNYKTKEKEVVTRIVDMFKDFTWVEDKKIQDGCSRKRPDLLLDLGFHVLIIEIDENKHNGYDCICENKRLMEISKDLGHRPVIFIRFNPDSYRDKNGNTVRSCWRIDKRGILSIMKTKKQEWEERIKILLEQVEYWSKNKTDKTVQIIELFY